MEIPKNLQEEIQYYCKINNIEDVNKFLVKILTNGFNIAKYGNNPIKILVRPEPEIKEVKIEPISLETSDEIKNIINQDLNEIHEKMLDIVKIPNELIEPKKRDLYDEE